MSITFGSGIHIGPGIAAVVPTNNNLIIANNYDGGLVGWGADVFAVVYDPAITSTYGPGSIITFQDGATATIVQIDDYGPIYLDIFFTPNKTGTIFPLTLSL